MQAVRGEAAFEMLGRATELERQVSNIEELCTELRAGRARPFRFDDAAIGPANE